MNMRRWFALALALGLFFATGPIAQAQEGGTKVHALTLGDAPKYGPDSKHLDYVNPDAPKGGTINLGATGTFDSLNPFIVKGTPAGLGGLWETLTTQTDDDALSEYGLLAESMEVADDKSWVIFNLRPEARWHDGNQSSPTTSCSRSTRSSRRAILFIATITATSRAWRSSPSAG